VNALVVEASLSFFSKNRKDEPIDRTYHSGLIVDFSIRKDMFNGGRIEFIEKLTAAAGEKDVKAIITFIYGELVLPFVKEELKYIFGEPSSPYGECKITKIVGYI